MVEYDQKLKLNHISQVSQLLCFSKVSSFWGFFVSNQADKMV